MGGNEEQLKKRYAALSDEALKEMLSAGAGDYEQAAYRLLKEEASRRGFVHTEGETSPAAKRQEDFPEPPASFVQIMVINSAQDLAATTRMLEERSIGILVEQISVSGKELPVSLLVEEGKLGEALETLKTYEPRSSICLW